MALRLLTLAGVCTIGVLIAGSGVLAQDNGAGGPQSAQSEPSQSSREEVTVTAPRSYVEKGDHGGAIRTIAMTGKVRFDDIDLSTPWGRTELKARIRVMASNLCGALERQYPVSAPGGPSCYEQALGKAMHAADRVLADTSYDYWKE